MPLLTKSTFRYSRIRYMPGSFLHKVELKSDKNRVLPNCNSLAILFTVHG